MRICHVITRLIVGGAQENTLLTCRGLHERGHDVTLITGPDAGPEGSLLEEARTGGYRVIEVPELHRAIHPGADWRAFRALQRPYREISPEIVHTHSSKAGILGRLAAVRTRVPMIVHTIHGMSFNRTQPAWKRGLFRVIERRCGQFTHALIGVADAMIDQAVEVGLAPRERCHTVYSGMRTDWYDPSLHDREAIRREWGIASNEIVAGTVARLFANKGYEQLIPAMAEAWTRCPALKFVWVGDGENRAAYERQLDEVGIRSRVILTGLVPPERVAALLAGMDFVVHASQWEGLPRVAVQASLMERPVISFAIDGAPEVVIPEKTGILVPLNHIDALSRAIVTMAQGADLRRRLGRAARRLCKKRFDHRKMVDAIERIYLESRRRADAAHEKGT